MTYDTNEEQEKVILFAVEDDKSILSAKESLEELAELAKTAGVEVLGTLIQNRDKVHSKHYFGKGKVEELRELVIETGADAVICDDELSSVQMKNLEQELQVKILDRTLLILDIFAGRAVSAEGKIQVELAQLKYRSSRLMGIGASMSRQGGGLGSKGPGEKKLEIDRRNIQDRIFELGKELEEVERHRDLLRTNRAKNSLPVVALVGYTNAGKSTLLNKLTDAGVLAEDKLFATLDTTARKIELTNGSNVILVDTVGFIQKLPHTLVKAFRATLEESRYADILIHVVDTSSKIRDEQMLTVEQTLTELKADEKPMILAYNKIDIEDISYPLPDSKKYFESQEISAFVGTGLDELKRKIETTLQSLRTSMKVLIPFTDGNMSSLVYNKCEIVSEEFRDNGTMFEIYANEDIAGMLSKYVIEE